MHIKIDMFDVHEQIGQCTNSQIIFTIRTENKITESILVTKDELICNPKIRLDGGGLENVISTFNR